MKTKITLLFALLGAMFHGSSYAQCNELFISEYVEGENNNKALEIYNASNSPVSLSNYRVIRFDNGNNYTEPLPAEATLNLPTNITMPPHSVYVIALNLTDPSGTGQNQPIDLELQAVADTLLCPGCATGTGSPRVLCFNGDDALALQKKNGNTWVNVDIFACIGERPSNSQGTFSPTAGWTILPPYSSMDSTYDFNTQGPYFLQYWTQDKTLLRKYAVAGGVTINPPQQSFNASVQWDSLPANTFYELGRHACECGCTEFVNAQASITAPVTSICAGGTVAATASITGVEGDNNFTYLWTNGATTANAQLPIGTHTVTISRIDGCKLSKTIEITESAPPVVQDSVVAPSACGSNNGSITLTITGNSGPYQVTWSNNSTGLSIDSLSAGNYIYEIVDAQQCSYNDVISISDPGASPVLLDSIVLASCDTCSDGAIYVSINVGSGAVYSWTSDGDSVSASQDVTGLSIGEYQLTVTFNGCVSTYNTSMGYLASVKELQQITLFNLFPNPAKNMLTFSNEIGMLQIEITDVNGKSCGLYRPGNNRIHSEDISMLNNGLYFAKVIDSANRISVKKFIKN